MESGSINQSLGHEIQNHQVRISHLEADCKQFEKTSNERLEEIRTADLTIKNYKDLNDDLCMKIEKNERTTKVEIKKELEEESSVVQELSDKINYLNDVIAQSEKQMAEKEKQFQMVTESNNEWEAKTRLLFVEIQQQELIQEKREYERNLPMSEMDHRY